MDFNIEEYSEEINLTIIEDGDLLEFSIEEVVEEVDITIEEYNGADGIGLKGDKPDHEWSGTQLRFENPDDTWGEYVDLKGEDGLSGIQSIQAGDNITIDNTDPLNPIISAEEGGTTVTKTSDLTNDGEDGTNPFISLNEVPVIDLSPYALKATTVNGKPLSANVSLTTSDINEGSNLYFTTARVLATVLTGISFVTGTAVVSTDTVLVAFGKLQKQITDILATVSGNTSAITALQAQTQVYKTISGNVTIDDSYHNAIVWITANSIITVDTTLRVDFNCVFFVIGTFTGTITNGSGVTFISPNGLVIGNNSSAHLSRYIANQFVLM